MIVIMLSQNCRCDFLVFGLRFLLTSPLSLQAVNSVPSLILTVCTSYTNNNLTLSTLRKISADDRLMIFSYFSQETEFDISCKLSPLEKTCMKCQISFSRNDKKNNISLSSAEFAHRVVKFKTAALKYICKLFSALLHKLN